MLTLCLIEDEYGFSASNLEHDGDSLVGETDPPYAEASSNPALEFILSSPFGAGRRMCPGAMVRIGVVGDPCIREQGRTPKIIKWTEIFLCFIHIFSFIYIGYLIQCHNIIG